MIELTDTKQRKDEHVMDYINRWRSLSLDCKDHLSELSAVEMCIGHGKASPFADLTKEMKEFKKDAKFYLDFGRSNMEKHAEADSIDLKDSKVQWVAIEMSKKRTKEVSIKLSPFKGDIQTNIDDEQPIFCYIPHERR
uniref:Retrotransposon protein n=1 Tax=Solanum tuberosum TaxID=4113 RepID=M1DFR6_SOLTU